MATIALRRLVKRFGSTVAVDDVSLDIPHGKLVCLLGPSGCGKTTTLRMIAGLEQPTSGEILFDGAPVSNVPPQRRGIGMVFQNYALFTHMTTYDNLAFGLRIRGEPRETVDGEVRRMAEVLELTAVLDHPAARLDLSTMQRVALGRTLITRPRVLLLDEPLNNIRPGLREMLRAELRRLQLDLNQTAVYVTHDQEEALSLADQVIIMARGKVEQIGSPDGVYRRPRNRFVAAFVGSPTMNFLPCEVTSRDGEPHLAGPGFVIPAGRRPDLGPRGRLIVLGIRPEGVRLGEGPVSAVVMLIQPAGADQIIELAVGDHRLRALIRPSLRLTIGQQVALDFPSDELHLFDAATGEALDG